MSKASTPGEWQPTDAELEILRVLWNHGPATVREVHTVLQESRATGYTTVLKLLQIMHEKGLVRRDESSRAHVYESAVSRTATENGLIDTLIDKAFEGSASRLVLRALAAGQATPEELAEIRALINQLEDDDR